MHVLGVIPARGGSQGVPRKNIRPLCGKPLLQYTAEAALAVKSLSCVILTTDDLEIADVGRELGLEVPFMRPAELATAETPTLPVLQHAITWMEKCRQTTFDAVCLLQPTTPIRRPGLIDACVSLLEATGADSVVTVLPVPHVFNPHWVYFEGENGWLRLSTGESSPIPRRQDLPSAYHREGSVYLTRRDVLTVGNSLFGAKVVGHLLDPSQCVNIDGQADWERAERLLAELA